MNPHESSEEQMPYVVVVLSIMFFSLGSYPQGPAASPSPTPIPVANSTGLAPQAVLVAPPITPQPAILTSISHGVDKIPSSIPTWLLAVLAFLVELAMRAWPTLKPRSIFTLAAQLMGVLGAGLLKIS